MVPFCEPSVSLLFLQDREIIETEISRTLVGGPSDKTKATSETGVGTTEKLIN